MRPPAPALTRAGAPRAARLFLLDWTPLVGLVVVYEGLRDLVPLIGARSRTRLNEALGALDVKLGEIELEAIDAVLASGGFAGMRYGAHQMVMLDSEKDAG